MQSEYCFTPHNMEMCGPMVVQVDDNTHALKNKRAIGNDRKSVCATGFFNALPKSVTSFGNLKKYSTSF